MDVVTGFFIGVACIYFLVFLISVAELLFSYILSKKGKLQLSFRLGFLLLVITLCAMRVVLLILTILLSQLDAFLLLQANVLLISFGNFIFFCAFYTVVLLFVRALKIQTGSLMLMIKGVSLVLCILHGLSQLVLSLIFTIRLGVEHEEIEEAHPEHAEGIDDEALLIYVSPWLYQIVTSIGIVNGLFTFLLSVAFLVFGLMIWKGLKEGSRGQSSTEHSHRGKISLVNKMLLLTLVVSISLIIKGIYGIYLAIISKGIIRTESFLADFSAEIVPLVTFQLVLYLSRREISSSRGTGSHSNSRSQSNSHNSHLHSHKEVSIDGKIPSSPVSAVGPTATELLNANEWLKVLTPHEGGLDAVIRIEKLDEVEKAPEEAKETEKEEQGGGKRDPHQEV